MFIILCSGLTGEMRAVSGIIFVSVTVAPLCGGPGISLPLPEEQERNILAFTDFFFFNHENFNHTQYFTIEYFRVDYFIHPFISYLNAMVTMILPHLLCLLFFTFPFFVCLLKHFKSHMSDDMSRHSCSSLCISKAVDIGLH